MRTALQGACQIEKVAELHGFSAGAAIARLRARATLWEKPPKVGARFSGSRNLTRLTLRPAVIRLLARTWFFRPEHRCQFLVTEDDTIPHLVEREVCVGTHLLLGLAE